VNNLIYGANGKTETALTDAQPYLNKLAASLGMKPDSEEFINLVYTADENDNPVLKDNVLANSLILTAAKETTSMDTSFLSNVNISTLKSDLDDPEKATTAMAQLALTYGMYTSYCQATGADNKAEAVLNSGSFSGVADALGDVNSEGFKTYLESDQGKADLKTYQASMGIISANSTNKDVAADILNNGVNSDAMAGLLGDLMKPAAAE